MEKQYNMRSPAVKRLMREAIELKDATTMYYAQPLEDNLFEWHFTIQGPQGTPFEGGCYHGRIVLPTEYPMKPPSIIMMTPNGRFELYQKICVSASSYHPELWQPSWSIRTVLLAIIGFMPTAGEGAIGSMECSPDDRRRMALRSLEWKCPLCGVRNRDILPIAKESSSQEQMMAEAADIISKMAFKSEEEVKKQKEILSKEQSPAQEGSDSTSSVQQSTEPDSNTSSLAPNPDSVLEPSQEGGEREGEGQGGLRQRVHQASGEPRPQPVTTCSRRGVASERRAGFASLLLMWVFVLAIGILVTRRLFITFAAEAE